MLERPEYYLHILELPVDQRPPEWRMPEWLGTVVQSAVLEIVDLHRRLEEAEKRAEEAERERDAYKDLYGRVERKGDYQTIHRAFVQAKVFVHSHVDDPDAITKVDLCEVSGSVPCDFIAWWEENKEREEVTEPFWAVEQDLRPRDDAYAVEVCFAWTWRGNYEYDYGWLIESVTVLGWLSSDGEVRHD